MVTRLTRLLLIKDSERREVAYFFGVFLLVGAGMALGRGTADALFFKRYGIEYLPAMYMLLSVVLMALSMAYAAFSDRLPAERLYKILFVALVLMLLVNWGLIVWSGWSQAYPLYFLIYEVASEILLVHGTLYLSQNLETQQLKRLSPLIFAGAQIGTIIGGLLLASSAHTIGVQNILLAWTLLITLTAFLIMAFHRRRGVSPYYRASRRGQGGLRQAVQQVRQGIVFTKDSDLLRTASFALFFMVIAFYTLCYSVHRVYNATFTSEEQLSSFYGMLTAITSSLALLIQLFLTNRLLRWLGVKRANLIFPTSTLLSFAALFGAFALPAALIGSFNKDSLTPAVRTPVRNLFFSALPAYMQGRARAMSIALVMPLALVCAGGMLWLAQRTDDPRWIVALGMAASAGYLYFTMRMNQTYVSSMVNVLKEKLFLPSQRFNLSLSGADERLIGELVHGVREGDAEIAEAYASMLMRTAPERGFEPILVRAQQMDPAGARRLLRLLNDHNSAALHEALLRDVANADSPLRAAMLQILFNQKVDGAAGFVEQALHSDDPWLKAAGVHGAMCFGNRAANDDALDNWRYLLRDPDTEAALAGLELLDKLHTPELAPELTGLARHDEPAVREAALKVLRNWSKGEFPGYDQLADTLYADARPAIRELCVHCAHHLNDKAARHLAMVASEDDHPLVRQAAVELLRRLEHADEHKLESWLLENRASPRTQRTMLEALRGGQPKADVWKEIAYSKAYDAQLLAKVAAVLQGGKDAPLDSHVELVGYILKERLDQTIELALLAMEKFEDPLTIGVVRAGLGSGDRRHIANACEVLRNLKDTKLANILGDILDEFAGHEETLVGEAGELSNAHDALTWCSHRRDPWLSQCAQRALEQYATGGA